MSWQDERDYDEEAFNAQLLREEDDPGDYVIDPDSPDSPDGPDGPDSPGPRDDADLTADAMKALEDRLLALVPADRRGQAQDWISSLLDLAPGEAMSPEDTHELARRVLVPRRTLTDTEINTYARFYPHREATDDSDVTSHPCVALGGDEDDDGAVQAYVYAEAGGVVISLHFDTAGPTEADGTGPWAYYGRDDAIPVTILGGSGEPVYVAAQGVPDLSDPLITDAHAALRAADEAAGDDSAVALASAGLECANILRAFLAITGHPVQPESRPEGGSAAEGGSSPEGGSETQGGTGDG